MSLFSILFCIFESLAKFIMVFLYIFLFGLVYILVLKERLGLEILILGMYD